MTVDRKSFHELKEEIVERIRILRLEGYSVQEALELLKVMSLEQIRHELTGIE